MADVNIDVSGTMDPTPPQPKSLFTLPTNLALSAPVAREWFTQRRQLVRPWTVFVNTSNFRAPNSLPRLSNRVMRNIEYFQSNYLFVFLGLIAYCLITSPLLLIVVAASLGGCYVLALKNAERKLSVFGRELTMAQQYGAVALCSMPVYYWAGAGQAVFWVIGASWFLITLHAACFNIDAVLSQEEDRFDLTMEEV